MDTAPAHNQLTDSSDESLGMAFQTGTADRKIPKLTDDVLGHIDEHDDDVNTEPYWSSANHAEIYPLSIIGEVVRKRTYARRLIEDKTDSPVESWVETCRRVVDSLDTQLNMNLSYADKKQVFDLLYFTKFSVAGRFLWQLGTKCVDKYGLLSLQNCAFITIQNADQPHKQFEWIFDCLMLGVGVGVNIQRKFVNLLPTVNKVGNFTRLDTKDADYIVPDTREGWVKLLGKMLKAHFYTGKGFTFSLQLLRSAGEPIKIFGGVASGSKTFYEGLMKIHTLLNRVSETESHKLTPCDVLDIIDIIGEIVVSGNVRRSALLMLGDTDDLPYLYAKNWGRGDIPSWRSNSNHSVVCNDINQLPAEYWTNGFSGDGEPYGLINLDLMRKCGRTGETQYSDELVNGTNPCGEQTLEDFETCSLAEVYLCNIDTYEDFIHCLTWAYRINKHGLSLKCHWDETANIVHKNMRMGIGLSGIAQANPEQMSWMSRGYEYIRKYDVKYSLDRNWAISKKITTVKPSGTLSLLGNCTAGVHPAFAQQYIRRVRFASDHPLVEQLRTAGYHCEYQKLFGGKEDHRTVVISFPVRVPDGTLLAENCPAVKQLELVKLLQSTWSDNSVSVTVTYKKEELDEIRQWLKENFNTHIKAVSFLLHSGHNFEQAPIEPIDRETYDRMVAGIKPLNEMEPTIIPENDADSSMECRTGMCPIR